MPDTSPPATPRLASTDRLAEFHTVASRNYIAHGIEGGLFMGGLAFVAVNSVLPRLADKLNAPAWVTSLTPVLLMMGFALPTVFTAHWVEKQHRVMPVLLFTGVFQRIPYLIAGLILLLRPADHIALWVVVLTPLISGLAGGFIATAWQELVAKTVKPTRRSSVFAIRNVLATGIGLVAGIVIGRVLERYPGMRGFGILHLICFGFLVLSYIAFSRIRETRQKPRDHHTHASLLQNLKAMPGIVARDRVFRTFLVARATSNAVFIVVPFMAIHALAVTGRPDAFLGSLVTAQMIGGILGNVFAGYVGDKHGTRTVALIGSTLLAAMTVTALFASTTWAFVAVFFALGLAQFVEKIGRQTMGIEISPFNKRSTYLALISFINVPSMLTASVISATLWDTTRSFTVLGVTAALLLGMTTLLYLRLPEPRSMARE
ncbi:MAG: MFS transporter [Chitinivibrionales bacterium]|nr:MFS transporter [Chitinivibrionales bacterium]